MTVASGASALPTPQMTVYSATKVRSDSRVIPSEGERQSMLCGCMYHGLCMACVCVILSRSNWTFTCNNSSSTIRYVILAHSRYHNCILL